MKGRKPKPTKIKLLHSNPGKRPINKNEPQPEIISLPAAPKHLDRKAAHFWRTLVKELEPLGMLARIDLQALARYCHLYSQWRESVDLTNKKGIILDDRIAPWVNVGGRVSQEMRALESSFGMGGAANRAKLKVDTSKPKTSFGMQKAK